VKDAARVALVGAILSICPTAGAAVVRVRAGCPGIAGADPLGHETKKAGTLVSVREQCGFDDGTYGSRA
jgi:hypothetical protein